MVEFNLLPDVKVQFLRSKRTEHLIATLSVIIGAVALGVFILLFLIVDVGQKVRLSQLNNEISTSSAKITSDRNLNQILTVQNQLRAIPTLEDQLPVTSRLFGYLTQITPPTATISSLTADFSTNSIDISGDADSLATVNTFVDTLQYATYNNTTNNSTNNQAFTNVNPSSISYSNSSTDGYPASYSIEFNFDPVLFNNKDNVTLVIPSETTTRSILNQPTLFNSSQ